MEYMFIIVTCCEELAKKLFEHFLQLYTRPSIYTSYCWKKLTSFPAPTAYAIFWHLCPHHCICCLHHCLVNSRTFQDLASRFPELSRTKVIFEDFPGPGNFQIKIPGLSRRHGNPEVWYNTFPAPSHWRATYVLEIPICYPQFLTCVPQWRATYVISLPVCRSAVWCAEVPHEQVRHIACPAPRDAESDAWQAAQMTLLAQTVLALDPATRNPVTQALYKNNITQYLRSWLEGCHKGSTIFPSGDEWFHKETHDKWKKDWK